MKWLQPLLDLMSDDVGHSNQSGGTGGGAGSGAALAAAPAACSPATSKLDANGWPLVFKRASAGSTPQPIAELPATHSSLRAEPPATQTSPQRTELTPSGWPKMFAPKAERRELDKLIVPRNPKSRHRKAVTMLARQAEKKRSSELKKATTAALKKVKKTAAEEKRAATKATKSAMKKATTMKKAMKGATLGKPVVATAELQASLGLDRVATHHCFHTVTQEKDPRAEFNCKLEHKKVCYTMHLFTIRKSTWPRPERFAQDVATLFRKINEGTLSKANSHDYDDGHRRQFDASDYGD